MQHTNPDFSVTRRALGPVTVVQVQGELDVETDEAFCACAEDALAVSRTVVVDLSRAEFLDCHGLGRLFALQHRAARDCRSLRLAGASGPVRILLEAFEALDSLGGRRSLDEELALLPAEPDHDRAAPFARAC